MILEDQYCQLHLAVLEVLSLQLHQEILERLEVLSALVNPVDQYCQ